MNEEILKIFIAELKKLNINTNFITYDTKIEDINIDSLDLMHIIVNVEEKYEIFFEESELRQIKTVKNLVDMCIRKMKDK